MEYKNDFLLKFFTKFNVLHLIFRFNFLYAYKKIIRLKKMTYKFDFY